MGNLTMWSSTSYTDTGNLRTINEDSVLDMPTENIWLVADGMGGHSHGDFASQLVVDTLKRFTSSIHNGISKARITSALNYCNTQLLEKAKTDDVDVVGCTVALLHARANSVLCTWSGDSRIYRLRNGKMAQLTTDHSQKTAVDDRDKLRHPKKPFEPSEMLTAAIGGDRFLTLEYCWYRLIKGDMFLICTDGLTKEVSDDEIHAILDNPTGNKQVLERLVELYQSRGARDNIGLIFTCKYC